MGIFRLPRFLRRYIRRNMHPMTEKQAWSTKTKLSVAYAFLAWNAFGYVCYQIMKGNKNWPITAGIRQPEEDMARPALAWAHSLGINKAKVYRVNGISGISPAQEIVVDEERETQEQASQNKDAEELTQ